MQIYFIAAFTVKYTKDRCVYKNCITINLLIFKYDSCKIKHKQLSLYKTQ